VNATNFCYVQGDCPSTPGEGQKPDVVDQNQESSCRIWLTEIRENIYRLCQKMFGHIFHWYKEREGFTNNEFIVKDFHFSFYKQCIADSLTN